MLSLRETQQAFLDAVLHEASHDSAARIAPLIAANGLAAERRIAIYRNNMREGFFNALRAAFPVVAQLGGEDWFAQTVQAYRRATPSRSGNLHYAGARFAQFLEQHLRGSDYRYFADVARLEWAYQEVLVAAEHPAFDIAALANIAPERYGSLVFKAHPAVRAVASDYPILAIWKSNQDSACESPAPLRLDTGPSRVLLIRRHNHVEMRELGVAEFALLQAFISGARLDAGAEAAWNADPTVDFAAALARIVALGTLVDFHLDERTAS